MFRTTVCAALALATLSTVTAGAAGACLTDPAGDVAYNPPPLYWPVYVDQPHLDLLAFGAVRTRRELVVVVYTGGDGNGVWAMFFRFGSAYDFHVRVQRDDGLPWAQTPDPVFGRPPVTASVTARPANRTRQVEGAYATFPGKAVHVHLPLTALGKAAPADPRRLQVRMAYATQSPAPGVWFEDRVACY